MANRQNFPRAVKREIARRAVNATGSKHCEKCGAVGVLLQLHHLKMDAMQTPEAKLKPLTAADGAMWCEVCHDPETATQRKQLARVEAREARHWLPRPPSKMKKSAPFAKTQKVRPKPTKVVPRRRMFEGKS